MADVTLKDGRELTIDLYQINHDEYELIRDPSRPSSESHQLLGKCVGMSGEEIGKLPLPDYKLLIRKFYLMARQPVPDDSAEKN